MARRRGTANTYCLLAAEAAAAAAPCSHSRDEIAKHTRMTLARSLASAAARDAHVCKIARLPMTYLATSRPPWSIRRLAASLTVAIRDLLWAVERNACCSNVNPVQSFDIFHPRSHRPVLFSGSGRCVPFNIAFLQARIHFHHNVPKLSH